MYRKRIPKMENLKEDTIKFLLKKYPSKSKYVLLVVSIIIIIIGFLVKKNILAFFLIVTGLIGIIISYSFFKLDLEIKKWIKNIRQIIKIRNHSIFFYLEFMMKHK